MTHHQTADKVTINYDSSSSNTTVNGASEAPSGGAPHRPGGHGLMMIACIPMLVIAVFLVVTGVVGIGFLIFTVACTAMMALMMRGMHGGSHGGPAGQEHTADSTGSGYR